MQREIFRYVFADSIDMSDVESSLLLSLIALESLHGESQVRLEASHAMDANRRTCVIDSQTDVGRDLNKLFVGFIRHDLGEDCFRVERVSVGSPAPELAATAA